MFMLFFDLSMDFLEIFEAEIGLDIPHSQVKKKNKPKSTNR